MNTLTQRRLAVIDSIGVVGYSRLTPRSRRGY